MNAPNNTSTHHFIFKIAKNIDIIDERSTLKTRTKVMHKNVNFHQYRSINECARKILALNWSYIYVYDLGGHTLFNVHNVKP